jgi:hypothetical protein
MAKAKTTNKPARGKKLASAKKLEKKISLSKGHKDWIS